jgi:hypothetical protein
MLACGLKTHYYDSACRITCLVEAKASSCAGAESVSVCVLGDRKVYRESARECVSVCIESVSVCVLGDRKVYIEGVSVYRECVSVCIESVSVYIESVSVCIESVECVYRECECALESVRVCLPGDRKVCIYNILHILYIFI